MARSFYFYDLETSGFSPRYDRIMQFAGQRTDENLKDIGPPDNFYIKMSPDILPDPGSVLIHGTTPQKTLSEGLNEPEFLKHFTQNIFVPNTVFLGYNSIRFDDEFMRFLMWRNFYDSYEWHWKDGSSRWDLLDLVRMTRALRPKGINWPFDKDGLPTNRLEDLSRLNKLNHTNRHDALGDVKALISLARLIKSKQPKLFIYLYNLRDKSRVKALVETGEPFIYTSGAYPKEFSKTTAVVFLAAGSKDNAAIVYDLRVDPTPYLSMSDSKLHELWFDYSKDSKYFPVKVLKYNKCPAIAPLNVLDGQSTQRLKLKPQQLTNHLEILRKNADFNQKLAKILEARDKQFENQQVVDEWAVDGRLYEGFLDGTDKTHAQAIRNSNLKELKSFRPDFKDPRLSNLYLLYRARNYPEILSAEETAAWRDYLDKKLFEGDGASTIGQYFIKIEELKSNKETRPQDMDLLEELVIYGQSLLPGGI